MYKIYRISSQKIIEAKFNIENYSEEDAIKSGDIISVPDNQTLHKIRDYKREHGLEIKQDGLIDDLVNVVVPMENKRSKIATDNYILIACNGFNMNGILYVRLEAGSGQIRRNTVTFVREEMYNYLFENLCCGLTLKDIGSNVNPAKFNAYFGLSFSNVTFIKTPPRVCIISDYEEIKPHMPIDFITTIENEEKIIEKNIEPYYYDDETKNFKPLNSFDGQGLVSPDYANIVARELGIDYTPAQMIIRAPWVKGCLVTFRWRDYCRESGVDILKDVYGVEHSIDDIDVLLSTSQFKMWKVYRECGGWQYYVDSMKKYNLRWGIVMPNKKHDDMYKALNYQYIQALNLTDKDIDELCSLTMDYLTRLCSGDYTEVCNYLFENNYDDKDETCCGDELGAGKEQKQYKSLLQKALEHNPSLIDDSYIRDEIYKQCQKKFKMAKLGKIKCRGSYQFIVSDPVAQIQAVIKKHGGKDIEVKGLIPANCVYSHYCNSIKSPGEIVTLMRSPLIDQSEVCNVELVATDEMKTWYDYLNSGIVQSIHDLITLKEQNSDYDGDRAMIAINDVLVRCALKDGIPILYKQSSPICQTITPEVIYISDVAGMNSQVGMLSNKAATFYALINQYPEHKAELLRRIKMLSEVVGVCIDMVKTGVKYKIPTNWKYKPIPKLEAGKNLESKISEEETALTKENNKLATDYKPYFLRANYNKLNEDIKTFTKIMNQESQYNFNMGISELLSLPSWVLMDKQKSLIKKYYNNMPAVDSDCSMNIICKKFEQAERALKRPKDSRVMLYQYASGNVISTQIQKEIDAIIKTYDAQKHFITKANRMNKTQNSKEIAENTQERKNTLNEYIRGMVLKHCNNNEQIAFDALCFLVKNGETPESTIWEVMGDSVFSIIPHGGKSDVCA